MRLNHVKPQFYNCKVNVIDEADRFLLPKVAALVDQLAQWDSMLVSGRIRRCSLPESAFRSALQFAESAFRSALQFAAMAARHL